MGIINVLSCSMMTISGSTNTCVLGVSVPEQHAGLLTIDLFAQDSTNAGNTYSYTSACHVNASGSVATIQKTIPATTLQPTNSFERLAGASLSTVESDLRVNFSGSAVPQFTVITSVSGMFEDRLWTPTSDGWTTWYDANLGVTVATGVSSWLDQSGNGNHATQATPALQPLFGRYGPNGRTAMHFNNVDQGLTIANNIGTNKSHTVAFGVSFDMIPQTPNRTNAIFQTGVSHGGYHPHLCLQPENPAVNWKIGVFQTDTGGGGHYVAGNAQALVGPQTLIWTLDSTASASIAYVNGVAGSSFAYEYPTSFDTGALICSSFYMCAINGAMWKLAYRNSVASAEQLARIHAWCSK